MVNKLMTTQHEPDEQNTIGWRVIAFTLGGVLWAILFAMMCWVVQSVGELKSQVAVLNNVLHISKSTTTHEESWAKIYKP